MELYKKKNYEYTNIYNRKKTRQVLKYDNKNKSVRDKTPNNSAMNSSNFSKIINRRKKILDKYINIKYSKNNHIIIKNLKKYNSSISYYNKEKIASLIFDGKFHYVSIFKDYLFWDDEVECLKKYYKINESTVKINQFINYYCTIYNSLNIYCIYFHLGDCKEVILKYYRKKIKLQQSIIENKNKIINDKNKIKKNKNKKIEKIIETHTKLISQSLNLSKVTPDELILDKKNNKDISKINTIQTTRTNSKIFKSRNDGDLLLIKKENKIKEFSHDETIKFLIKNLTHKKKKSKICIHKYNKKKKDILNFKNIDKLKQIVMKISSCKNSTLKKDSHSPNKKIKNSFNILNTKPLSNHHSAKHLYIKIESNKITFPRYNNKMTNNLRTFNIKDIILNNKNDNKTCLTERNNSKGKKQKNPLGIYFDNFKKMKIKIVKNINKSKSKIYFSSKTSPKTISKSANKILYFNKNVSNKTITKNNSQLHNLRFDKLKLYNFKKLSIKSKSHNKYYI